MKTVFNRIALFAACTAIIGTLAYGQTSPVNVHVPFAFHTVNGASDPGSYTLRYQRSGNDSTMLALRGNDSHRTEYLFGIREGAGKGEAAVIFRCAAGSCVLSGVRTAEGVVAYNTRLAARYKEAAEIIVPLKPVNAD